MACKCYIALYVGSSALDDLTFLLGEEVALYCAKYLPDIIKDQKAYKEGKLQKVCLFVVLLLYFCRLSLVFQSLAFPFLLPVSCGLSHFCSHLDLLRAASLFSGLWTVFYLYVSISLYGGSHCNLHAIFVPRLHVVNSLCTHCTFSYTCLILFGLYTGIRRCLLGYRCQTDHWGSHQGAGTDCRATHWGWGWKRKSSWWRWWWAWHPLFERKSAF